MVSFFKHAVFIYFLILLVIFTFSGCTLWLDADEKRLLITSERIENGKTEKKE